MGHTMKIEFENGDVNSRMQLNATGVPNGILPLTLLDKTPTPRTVENRPHTFEMYWDEENKALCVDFLDMEYPLSKGNICTMCTQFVLLSLYMYVYMYSMCTIL